MALRWLVNFSRARNGRSMAQKLACELMDAANVVLDDNTITSHIKRIRRKFHAIDPDFDSIETVYGMGYRWLSN